MGRSSGEPAWEEAHPEVFSALLAAGWAPGRSVDISGWEELLRNSGFGIHDTSRRVWNEFGMLTIRSGPRRIPGSSLSIDPVDACIDAVNEARRLSRRYGELYAPLGMWSIQYRSYIGSGGRVLAIGPSMEWELGKSFSAALDFVVVGGYDVRVAQK